MNYERATLGARGGRGRAGIYEISGITTSPPQIRYSPASVVKPTPHVPAVRASVREETTDDGTIGAIGVHSSKVPIRAWRTAELALSVAVWGLALPQKTRIFWYRPTSGDEWPYFQAPRAAHGFHHRGDLDGVWIKLAPADAVLVRTVGHELRHAYQDMTGRWQNTTPEDKAAREEDAERWAWSLAERFTFSTDGWPIFYA